MLTKLRQPGSLAQLPVPTAGACVAEAPLQPQLGLSTCTIGVPRGFSLALRRQLSIAIELPDYTARLPRITAPTVEARRGPVWLSVGIRG